MNFEPELKSRAEEISAMLETYLPEEKGFRKLLSEACNYSVRAGGKRLRPMLMLETYRLCGGKQEEDVAPFMAAMEMIHSASLVHDDLPCMDNDTLRRGKPSTWARYGEDIGTLAGDGLMIFAFETACRSGADPELKNEAIRVLAEKSGIYGMIGGQTLDVQLTGQPVTEEQLRFIYENKTSALIEASFMIGALLAGAEAETVKLLEKAASGIGLAFQIRDDLLDVISTTRELGKPTGSDERNVKTTWVTCFGKEASESFAAELTRQSLEQILKIGEAPFLTALLTFLLERRY